MKLINWIRVTWDLSAMPTAHPALSDHYEISPATPADEKELRRVISSSLLLDPDWNPAIRDVMETVENWLAQAFASPLSVFLILRHGTRIIGATVLSLDPISENQLAPGPCILTEYRNRGFGTALLHHSLVTLKLAGFSEAVAIAKENAPATKFLYTKFNGVFSSYDFTPLLAA